MKIDSNLLVVEILATGNALWAAARPFFSRFDLSEAHFNVLNILATASEPLSQRALSEQLLTDKSAVTGLIDRMEKKELLRRTPSPTDRRVYHLQLTSKGRALWRRVHPHYLKEVDRLFSGISAAHQRQLHDCLQQIKARALERSKAFDRNKPLHKN